MRLLKRRNAHDYRLTDKLIDDDVPRYAILSHTWGLDSEEVTFEDLVQGSGETKTKAGYGKIEFCGEQAARGHLQYFWVDSCVSRSEATQSFQSR